MINDIDHVAIAVNDLDQAVSYYQDTFQAVVEHREIISSDLVEEALIKVGTSYIQLLAPISDESSVAKFLEKRGEGLHHVGYRVENCSEALKTIRAKGVATIDEIPRPGSRGTTVAFVHPKDGLGTLIELVQTND